MVAQAVLLVSHGTVDDLADLPAFLTNVRRGRPPEDGLVAELRRRYDAIGGKSPLNANSADVAQKLERRLGVPVAWSNRLWKPYVHDVISGLGARGIGHVAVVPLAQHSAAVYAIAARAAAAASGVTATCAADWGGAPRLHAAFADRIVAALARLRDPAHAAIVMCAHSLPTSIIAAGDPYESELRASAEAIGSILGARLGRDPRWILGYQSQSLGARGPDGKPLQWLGPDLKTCLDRVVESGASAVVFAPIGFLADHVEILYDLDVEARAMATERRLEYGRAASLNADDDFIDVLAGVARPLLEHG